MFNLKDIFTWFNEGPGFVQTCEDVLEPTQNQTIAIFTPQNLAVTSSLSICSPNFVETLILFFFLPLLSPWSKKGSGANPGRPGASWKTALGTTAANRGLRSAAKHRGIQLLRAQARISAFPRLPWISAPGLQLRRALSSETSAMF